MPNEDSSNPARDQTEDQNGAPAVLPLGPEMKEAMMEWYEYHIRLAGEVDVSIAVTLADIMADNRHATAHREAGVGAFGYISIPLLPDLVHWVLLDAEEGIKILSDDLGPNQCYGSLCFAVLAEFFRDIRETKPELESIHSPPLPQWIRIYRKLRAECTGRLPDRAADSIH